MLFHHDPLHSDDELEEMLADAQRSSNGSTFDIELAHEGRTFSLPA